VQEDNHDTVGSIIAKKTSLEVHFTQVYYFDKGAGTVMEESKQTRKAQYLRFIIAFVVAFVGVGLILELSSSAMQKKPALTPVNSTIKPTASSVSPSISVTTNFEPPTAAPKLNDTPTGSTSSSNISLDQTAATSSRQPIVKYSAGSTKRTAIQKSEDRILTLPLLLLVGVLIILAVLIKLVGRKPVVSGHHNDDYHSLKMPPHNIG
jgi:hypothetical protein